MISNKMLANLLNEEMNKHFVHFDMPTKDRNSLLESGEINKKYIIYLMTQLAYKRAIKLLTEYEEDYENNDLNICEKCNKQNTCICDTKYEEFYLNVLKNRNLEE